jgi:diguanylate cyclase (GGDEF)-like protein
MSASAFRRGSPVRGSALTGRVLLRRLIDEHVGLLREVTRLRASGQMTYHDPLTGLGNRRYLEMRLGEELSRARRNPSCTGSLLLVDVDSLRSVNARHGYGVGDRTLRWMAIALKEILPGNDVVCRTTGGEFIALLCDTDPRAAGEIVARLEATLATGRAQGHRWSPPGVSIGMAGWPGDASTVPGLMAAAYARLADAKGGPAQRRRPRLTLVR